MELSDKSHFIWYNIVKTILLEDFRMEETLKWALPVVIPLIISVSTALISSKSTIKKTKEGNAYGHRTESIWPSFHFLPTLVGA